MSRGKVTLVTPELGSYAVTNLDTAGLLIAAMAKPTDAALEALRPHLADGALLNRTPILVAYVDSAGWPHLSLRGTTQVFSPTQLALWVRDPEGGILKAIPNHPEVALWYRDTANRTTYQFAGRAHVDT